VKTIPHPKSKDLIDLLVAKFREDGRRGKYKATGIVYDLMTVPPGATEKTDAIAVRAMPVIRIRGPAVGKSAGRSSLPPARPIG
jgi:hypothetical protein